MSGHRKLSTYRGKTGLINNSILAWKCEIISSMRESNTTHEYGIMISSIHAISMSREELFCANSRIDYNQSVWERFAKLGKAFGSIIANFLLFR